MSSGVDSNQGGGAGNSQLSIENMEYVKKMAEIQAEIQAEINTSGLTDPQKSTLNTLNNTVKEHLTVMDYSGVERDLAGNPVPNGKGGYFDHIQEMKDSYKYLKKSKKSLEGSLKNPNLGEQEKSMLEEALKVANYHINKIDQIFNEYGGIEEWKKK